MLRAYDIGREAVKRGLGILDVVALNNETLGALLQRASTLDEALLMTRAAAKFLLEVLAPLEMTLDSRKRGG